MWVSVYFCQLESYFNIEKEFTFTDILSKILKYILCNIYTLLNVVGKLFSKVLNYRLL